MLAHSGSELHRPFATAANARRREDGDVRETRAVRKLAGGELLFQAGDTRARIYRVERGALCHYVRWDDGRKEIIEFAFPGDMIGFGNLEQHISAAQAMVDTAISVVSGEEFERALNGDAQLAARLAAAADREFDYLRARATESTKGKPVERLAAFLSAVSHLSANEGRDPLLVSDEIPSGYIAEHLDMTIDGLLSALRELEQRGIVRATKGGLRIADLHALENLGHAA
jgi:CRP/FNR family transcriptional regulator, anaerobic regulatory protein